MKVMKAILVSVLFFAFVMVMLLIVGATEVEHPWTMFVTSVPCSIAMGVMAYRRAN